MTLSELKNALHEVDQLRFTLADSTLVPEHFHLTEIGKATKTFIDCGGKHHQEHKATLQLWVNTDVDHRLSPKKFRNIIRLSEPLFNGEDLEVEVEYQTGTVGKYGLSFNGSEFVLQPTTADCLAPDLCGIDAMRNKKKISLGSLGTANASCVPGSGCC